MKRSVPAAMWFVVLLAAALILPTSVRSAAQPAQSPSTLIDRAGGAYNGIEVTLATDAAPAPGSLVTLTLTVRPLRDAPNVYVEWELPDGGELLGGPANDALGPVAAGQSVTIARQVRLSAANVYQVSARAFYFPDQAISLAARGVLFFDIRDGRSTVSDLDPRAPVYTPPPARPTVDKSHLAGASTRAADGCFTVRGTLTRENRMPFAEVFPEPGLPAGTPPRYVGKYSQQQGSAVPVHHVLVEMREEDNVSDDSYGHTVTDRTGNFRFNFCDDDGVLNDTLELYFRVCAEVRDGNSLIARVEQTDEQEVYCWDSDILESDGGDVDFDLTVYRLNQTQAKVFNIADSLYWAWRFWNDNAANSPAMDRAVTVHWQEAKGAKGSFYSDDRTTMVIADDPSSADEWDDSVILHEWGHFADHQFSCNQNPGGRHSLPGVNAGVNGMRLAFGEGYPNYYQAVARSLMPGSASLSFYIDPDGPTVDLENMRSVTTTDRDEGAIAALLWDFYDTANDGQDTVSHGHAAVQRVFAAADFKNNATCDMTYFLQVWRKLGLPADAATAATVTQNVNINLETLPPLPATAAGGVTAEQPPAPLGPTAAAAVPPQEYRWWDQVTMVIDTSASMAGPAAAPKINSVKTIIREQVNDLLPDPEGVEFNIYTFDGLSATNRTLLERRFFPQHILPPVDALAATGPDLGCYVAGLNALQKATLDKFDGQAWLYTDGDTTETSETTSVEFMRQWLNERRLRGSIVLLGGCSTPPPKQSSVSGAERTYLNLAADGSQPTGMVPYLLTAMGSGGQFIYVAPDQLANAVDMVRAQLSHTAGAGRWSDYVSNVYTYRWDRLEPWEYQWMPAESLGQDAGQLYSNAPTRIQMPNAFPFYGDNTTTVDVYEDGFIRMNPCLVADPFCPSFGWQYLNLLERDLQWRAIEPGPRSPEGQSPADDETGPQVHVYTVNFAFEWFIISTQGIADYDPNPQGFDFDYRAYQTWLNYKTGEIRFMYDKVRTDAAAAEISLINDYLFATAGNVVVSNNDVSGATSGMGYKFTPAPPQPTRIYDVDVDPLIESVVFLQTGYSGNFAPMTVTYPDGSAVNCNDAANVRCLTVNNKPGDRMVQFVQVNTNGQSGIYTATVGVGSGSSATFSFNALAASALQASSPNKHTLALKEHSFLLDLGRATDDNRLQGWLQTPAGVAFGSPFTLYDDGAHGDGAAGDGRFGSDTFTPPRAGAAYLWVEGVTGGVAFRRSDPAPFNFQPLDIWASEAYGTGRYQEGYYGDPVPVHFYVTNQDRVVHCYRVDFTVPAGWTFSSPFLYNYCVPPQTTSGPYLYVSRPPSSSTQGEIGEVTLTLTEVQEGSIAGSASTQVALFRRPAALEFDNRQVGPIRPNGTDTVELMLNLIDDLGQPVGYSGPFSGELTVTGGTYELPTGSYENGRLRILFTAGNAPGTATLSALAEGGLTAETTIELAEPTADQIELAAAPIDLSTAGQSALTVTVHDAYGDPVRGETVRLSVSDDAGDQGTIGGSEVFEGATNVNGQLRATFVKTAGGAGEVVVRAELIDPGGTVLRETSITLYLSGVQANYRLMLPMVRR